MLKSDPNATKGLREVDELEDRIEKLRLSFEQFFSGTNNIDPSDKKLAIRRIISKLNQMRVRNPRVRFRFQSLVGRFVSLDQYWTRTMRKMEEGTMTRGMFFRSSELQTDAPKAYYGNKAPEVDTGESGDAKKSPDTKQQGSPQSSENGIGDKKIDRIYSDFVEARKANNDSAGNVKRETLKKSIETQYENLKRKYKTDKIDFKVVKKDGKVVLRPVVKK